MYRAHISFGDGYGSRTELTEESGTGITQLITREISVQYLTQGDAKNKTNLISVQCRPWGAC